MKLKLQEAQELSYMDANGSVHGLLNAETDKKPIFETNLSPDKQLAILIDEYNQLWSVFRRVFVL